MTDGSLTPRGAETRRRLLVAAGDELIAEKGKLEVARVAARASVSVGLLYRYFEAKAGLIAAVVDQWYDRMLKELGAIDGRHDETDWAALQHHRTKQLVDFHYREPLAPVMMGMLAREPATAEVEARRIRGLIDEFARVVEVGVAAGDLRPALDVQMVGAVLVGGFRGAIGEALARPRRPPSEVLTAELWRMTVDVVRYRPRD